MTLLPSLPNHNLCAMPSKLFSNMPALIKLINLGRYFELGDNSKNHHQRNNLLPSVAFQDVDICIGSAFGGTASYECSLRSIRSVLVDVKYVSSPLLDIAGDHVLFSSLSDFLTLLSSYSTRSLLLKTSIGIWPHSLDTSS